MNPPTKNDVLVVAFDGADYEYISKNNMSKLKQKEFGRIDNDTKISQRVTSELFASFITGQTQEEHTAEGLRRYENEKIDWFESKLGKKWPLIKFRGIRETLYENINTISGGYKRTYKKSDLAKETLFEKIENSKALNVPSYSENSWIDMWAAIILKKHGVNSVLRHANAEFNYRKKELFDSLENDYNLLMAHFHYIDTIQDLFHKFNTEQGGKEKIKEAYKETSELAGEIRQNAKFDTVIFMSDHGLPEGNEHNKNAFYSCNHELFPDTTPHITDFHDKILELTDTPESEVGGIDV